jgi:hypothetical protein
VVIELSHLTSELCRYYVDDEEFLFCFDMQKYTFYTPFIKPVTVSYSRLAISDKGNFKFGRNVTVKIRREQENNGE